MPTETGGYIYAISTKTGAYIYAISTEGGGHAAPDVLGNVQNVGGGGHGVLAALLLHLRRTYHLSDTRGVNEA